MPMFHADFIPGVFLGVRHINRKKTKCLTALYFSAIIFLHIYRNIIGGIFMSNILQLLTRRKEIIGEMNEIKTMRKGVLITKHQKVKHKNGNVVVKGPYYELTKKGPGGKTIAQSIPVKDAGHIQSEVDNYKNFRQLSDEYVDICEKISIINDSDTDSPDEAKKK
jgi:hypothetical protein